MREPLSLYFVPSTIVFLDTSFLANKHFAVFYSHLMRQLQRTQNAQIAIPSRVFHAELPRLAHSGKPDANAARTALLLLQQALDQGRAFLIPDRGECENADQLFLSLILSGIAKYNFLVFTQDNQLAQGINGLDLRCIPHPKQIRVFRMNNNDGSANIVYPHPLSPEEEAPSFFAAIPLCAGRPAAASPMLTAVPRFGESFPAASGSYVQVGNRTAAGFFSIIGAEESCAAFPLGRTTVTSRKLRLLHTLGKAAPKDAPLLLPHDLLLDRAGQAIGYTVSFAGGAGAWVTLKEYAGKLCARPQADLQAFAANLAEAVAFAHRCGIVLGGLDPSAIYLDRKDLRVRIGAGETWQVSELAAAPAFAPLAANQGYSLLSPLADAKPLALLATQVLTCGQTADPAAAASLTPQLAQVLSEAVHGRGCAARHLRKAILASPAKSGHEWFDGGRRDDTPASDPLFSLPAIPAPTAPRICKDCGKTFALTAGEVDFFTKKGLELPLRCPACRSARAKRQPEQADASSFFDFAL